MYNSFFKDFIHSFFAFSVLAASPDLKIARQRLSVFFKSRPWMKCPPEKLAMIISTCCLPSFMYYAAVPLTLDQRVLLAQSMLQWDVYCYLDTLTVERLVESSTIEQQSITPEFAVEDFRRRSATVGIWARLPFYGIEWSFEAEMMVPLLERFIWMVNDVMSYYKERVVGDESFTYIGWWARMRRVNEELQLQSEGLQVLEDIHKMLDMSGENEELNKRV
ncbi:hypothetical protein F5884DRAFT_890774 [Xylogone sp. PMI_703]|nr:hypothetical protein F5884DRAFT_890774 [Xylogone sp. PMI_703]